jgi:hypothetical protein
MKERLVAHRGNAAECKENSLDAIKSAIELGLSYVEVDVQMSSDAVPFLIHDASLRRLYALDKNTSDCNALFLQELGVATLAQAIEIFQRHDITAFVEIKADSLEMFGRAAVVSAICEKLTPQCVVISFDQVVIKMAQARGFQVGLVLRDMSEETRRQCDALSPEYVFCDHRQILRNVWAGPVWVAYDVAEHKTAHRLTGLGVKLLETMSVRKMSAPQ